MRRGFYIKLYLLTAPVFLAVDFVWLAFVAGPFYRTQLGQLLSPQPNWSAAIGFYLVYVVGILVFAVRPALASGSLRRAGVLGALFGFFTYATYDLTNLATLRDWPWQVAAVDIIWGTLLCAGVATIAYLFGAWLADSRHATNGVVETDDRS